MVYSTLECWRITTWRAKNSLQYPRVLEDHQLEGKEWFTVPQSAGGPPAGWRAEYCLQISLVHLYSVCCKLQFIQELHVMKCGVGTVESHLPKLQLSKSSLIRNPKIVIFWCALNGKCSALYTNSIASLSEHFSYPNTLQSQHVSISNFLVYM